MPWADPRQMKEAGFRPTGTGPSPLETIAKSAGQFMDSYFEAEERRAKKQKEKLDAYITYRKAGYESNKAAELAETMAIPKELPKFDVLGAEAEVTTMKPKKAQYELDKEKAEAEAAPGKAALEAQEKKASIREKWASAEEKRARAKSYREKGSLKPKTAQEQLRQTIIDDLDSGARTIQDLTPEEKKLVFNYTPAKGSTSVDIKGALQEKAAEAPTQSTFGRIINSIFGGAKVGAEEQKKPVSVSVPKKPAAGKSGKTSKGVSYSYTAKGL